MSRDIYQQASAEGCFCRETVKRLSKGEKTVPGRVSPAPDTGPG